MYSCGTIQVLLTASHSLYMLADPSSRHQKQALTFMQRREQGWNFSKQNKDIWQRRYERIDDYASLEQQPTSYDRSNVRSTFYNVVTRQTLVTEPMQFKGGILADPMYVSQHLIASLFGQVARSLIDPMQGPRQDLEHNFLTR